MRWDSDSWDSDSWDSDLSSVDGCTTLVRQLKSAGKGKRKDKDKAGKKGGEG